MKDNYYRFIYLSNKLAKTVNNWPNIPGMPMPMEFQNNLFAIDCLGKIMCYLKKPFREGPIVNYRNHHVSNIYRIASQIIFSLN